MSENGDRVRLDKIEAELKLIRAQQEKFEAMTYEERAKTREQQVQIDHLEAQRTEWHARLGRNVERVILIGVAAIGWFWDHLVGK